MSYLDRLRTRATAPEATGKTGKSTPSHGETEGDPTGKTGKSPLLPVLPVPPEGISENRDPLPDLYRRWFEGMEEPRAFLSLDPSQAREAVAVGAVPSGVAAGCVLLAYRSPLGAVGILAIPREKWDPFALLTIMEGAPCLH